MTAYVKEHGKIDLKTQEAIGLYLQIDKAWSAKKKSWEQPDEESATSPSSTDLQSVD